jgi:hypothetical protein
MSAHRTIQPQPTTRAPIAPQADRARRYRRPTPRASAAPSHAADVKVEGLTTGDAGFDAGSTPAPVVINLCNDATSCATNTYRQLVLVSISPQHLWACEGGREVSSTAVTTGATVDHDRRRSVVPGAGQATRPLRRLVPATATTCFTGCRLTATSACTTHPGRRCHSDPRTIRNTVRTAACMCPQPRWPGYTAGRASVTPW